MFKPFTDHPASVGESYWQHMGQASYFAICMIGAGFACALHGLFPFLFTSTGRRTIVHLHDRMVMHRRRGEAESFDWDVEPAE